MPVQVLALVVVLSAFPTAQRCSRGLRRGPLSRSLRGELPRSLVVAAGTREPARPLPPLIVRDAQPAEVSAIAVLLSAAFYPEREGVRGVGVGGDPSSLGGDEPPWSWAWAQMQRASADVGTWFLEASLASRLSTEAFSQGFDGRPPAATLDEYSGREGVPGGPSGGLVPGTWAASPGKSPSDGQWATAYALLVAEVELTTRGDGSGDAQGPTRELVAAVELGLEEINTPALVEQQGGGGSGGAKAGPRRTPYLASLAVAPAYRGCGAARKLLAKAETLVLAWGYDEIVLDAASSNIAAVELYASSGAFFIFIFYLT
ncbi:hypothetical protein T492DRAFT_488124 [Pavlovales sp. CCMP2436]|nr:hypothetical protein T492DRAFT_488124 [Pavlovales sp. CCMP2436]